jgi:hypothetical protein
MQTAFVCLKKQICLGIPCLCPGKTIYVVRIPQQVLNYVEQHSLDALPLLFYFEKKKKKANFVHVRDAVASFHTQEKQQC